MDKFWKWVKDEAGNESELLLEGVIASSSWWGDEVTPKAFKSELKKHTGDITVRINSPGGDVFAGVSIYNALVEHDGKVTVKVDALAASAASFVAMAGEDIIMLPGSMMMIHNPWTFAMGDKDELAKVVEMLEKTGDSIASIYVARTGKSEEEISELLAAETWMTAQEAVDLGFATEAQEPKKPTVSDAIKNALSYAGTVRNAVMQPAMSIKAKTDAKEVEELNVSDTTKEPAQALAEEPKAPDEPKADDEEVKPDATETAEPVAEEEVNQPQDKETIMTEEEKVAATQVIEPKDQADPQAAPKPSVKDYLNSKESMEAFARILEANAGKTSEDVRADWKKHLEVKAGVTNPEIFLPTPLVSEIEDAFKEGGEIWNRVSKTGLDAFNAAWDSNTDPDAETGRAAGYNREDEEEKREQELTFANRILRPQMVYKYITLNREDVKEQRTTGAMVRFVLSELPRRIIREVERAIVLGDGRAPGSDYKIQEGNPRGFYPILADAVAGGSGNVFASLYTPEAGEDHYASVVRANDLLEAEGTPVLVCKKGYVTDMKLTKNENGGYIFPIGSDFKNVLEVESIIQPDWFTNASSPDVDAVLVVLPRYRLVGDQSVEAFQNFVLKTNKHEYLQEIWAGGGLTSRKSAVAIAAETS